MDEWILALKDTSNKNAFQSNVNKSFFGYRNTIPFNSNINLI